jgi:hypothetical protein
VGRLALLLLLARIVVACGDASPGHIDPELQPYVETFIAEGNARGLSLTSYGLTAVFVEELPGRTEARCFIAEKRIEVERKLFDKLIPSSKEKLMYHELGHCLLQLGHSDDPDNLMFSNARSVEGNSTELLINLITNHGGDN